MDSCIHAHAIIHFIYPYICQSFCLQTINWHSFHHTCQISIWDVSHRRRRFGFSFEKSYRKWKTIEREKKLSRYFSIRYAAVYCICRWCGTRRRMRGYWLMYKHSVVSFFMPTQRNRFSFIYWYGEIVAVRRNHTASHRIIVGDKRYIHTYIHT